MLVVVALMLIPNVPLQIVRTVIRPFAQWAYQDAVLPDVPLPVASGKGVAFTAGKSAATFAADDAEGSADVFDNAFALFSMITIEEAGTHHEVLVPLRWEERLRA